MTESYRPYDGPEIPTDFSDLVRPSGGGAPRTTGSETPPATAESSGSSGGATGDSDEPSGRTGATVSLGAVIVIVVVAALVVGIIVFIAARWNVANNQEKLPAESTNTSQVNQAPAPVIPTAAPTDDNDPATSDSDGQFLSGDSNDAEPEQELSIAKQAASLDSWFKDVPDSFLETKTTAELGVDPETPLGEFCAYYSVVLSDGTIVTRGTLEDGQATGREATPTVITDYVVPEKWYNSVLITDVLDTSSVCVVSPEAFAEYGDRDIRGAVWVWDSEATTYEYLGTGTCSHI